MKETVKKLIMEFHKRELLDFKEREIKIPLDSKKIVTLIGPRRSGKTFLLYQLISKIPDKTNVIYINFEDERLDLEKKNLDLIIEAYFELYPEKKEKDIFIFFDEIQEIKGWEKFVRRVYDTITANIFLTGSSAKLFSKEIATSLRGRTITYEILPLSFKEYLKFRNTEIEKYTAKGKSRIIREFNNFMQNGGFPETVDMDKVIQRKTLNDYLDVMIYRDIVERHEVKALHPLNYLIKKILTNPAQEISLNKIYNEIKSSGLKVTKDSLYKFVKYLEDAFIIFSIRNYSPSLTKQTIKKFCPVDTALSTNNLITISEEFGKLMEIISYLHLRRQEFEIYYYSGKKECDFLVKEKNKIKEVIQVSKSIKNEKTKKREIEGLVEAMKRFKLKKGLILTYDEEGEMKRDGKKIIIKPLWKWLLD